MGFTSINKQWAQTKIGLEKDIFKSIGYSSSNKNVVFTDPKVEQTSSEADSELSSHSIPYHTG